MFEWIRFEPKRKWRRTAKLEDLEASLIGWFKESISQNAPISGPLMLQKSDQLAKQMGIMFSSNPGWSYSLTLCEDSLNERSELTANLDLNKIRRCKAVNNKLTPVDFLVSGVIPGLRTGVGITSIAIDQWITKTFGGYRLKILAASNYIRKIARLADSTQTKSSTDYNNENLL
ncbi:hypothetical protein TNCV_3761601 [Trichonephila clavipes]|nr:hypothetical protein TNCV_3761601 [Trichonephila clavipes]